MSVVGLGQARQDRVDGDAQRSHFVSCRLHQPVHRVLCRGVPGDARLSELGFDRRGHQDPTGLAGGSCAAANDARPKRPGRGSSPSRAATPHRSSSRPARWFSYTTRVEAADVELAVVGDREVDEPSSVSLPGCIAGVERGASPAPISSRHRQSLLLAAAVDHDLGAFGEERLGHPAVRCCGCHR